MTTISSTSAIEQLVDHDTSLFRVPSQLTAKDKVSLLAVAHFLHDRDTPYTYMEIGSHLGGSLQIYFNDPLCSGIVSIDKRPETQPDDRGHLARYSSNSTRRMIEGLKVHYGQRLGILRCIDGDTNTIKPDEIPELPTFCFIDAEHTREAVYRDFLFCLEVTEAPSVIGFHDASSVGDGLLDCVQHLNERSIRHQVYFLPDEIILVEIGDLGLSRHPAICERMAQSGESVILHLATLAAYRKQWLRFRSNRLVSLCALLSRPLRRFF